MYIISKENVKKGGKMLYQYESFNVKPKLNIKKVFLLIIMLIILALCIYSGIQSAKYKKEKQMEIEQAKIIEEEKRLEQERIAEEARKEQEKYKPKYKKMF